jgi:hypothetical protein
LGVRTLVRQAGQALRPVESHESMQGWCWRAGEEGMRRQQVKSPAEAKPEGAETDIDVLCEQRRAMMIGQL